jgi:glyoxylase I family protein
MITPSFIHHIVFRVKALDRTDAFYTPLLGTPIRLEQGLLYSAGETKFFFTLAAEQAAPYDKENVGLNHLAFGISTLADLQTIAAQLTTAGIPNSGIKLDPHGKKDYIWLDDPEGVRVEFYLA